MYIYLPTETEILQDSIICDSIMRIQYTAKKFEYYSTKKDPVQHKTLDSQHFCTAYELYRQWQRSTVDDVIPSMYGQIQSNKNTTN